MASQRLREVIRYTSLCHSKIGRQVRRKKHSEEVKDILFPDLQGFMCSGGYSGAKNMSDV
jgi:hypothetical protein